MTHKHLIIIGGQRSGTTLLADRLSSIHGVKVSGASPPEPKYFINPNLPVCNETYTKTVFGNLKETDRWLVEKSTSYYEHFDALRRIHATLPDAVIVLMMRDPIERAISNFQFSVQHGLETRDINSALVSNDLPAMMDGVSVSPFAYKQRSLFGRTVEILNSVFDPVYMRFLVLEELVTEPCHFARFTRSLGLESPAKANVFPVINASTKVETAVSHETYAHLVSYFREDVHNLFNLLGRQIPHWNNYE